MIMSKTYGPLNIPTVLEDIREPVFGSNNMADIPQQEDIPAPVRRELLEAASRAKINYYWLCGVYRQGMIDARRRIAQGEDPPVEVGATTT